MNEIDRSKYENIINRSKPKAKKNYFKNLLIRIMIVVILFLSILYLKYKEAITWPNSWIIISEVKTIKLEKWPVITNPKAIIRYV